MKKIKALALLTAVVMLVSLFAACGASGSASKPAESETESPATSAPAASQTDEPTGEPTDEPEAAGFPLTEEESSFSMWIVAGPLSLAGMSDYNEGEFYKHMEELTNVHIDFAAAPAGEEMTNFNIVLAGGDYMDAFAVPDANAFYVGGLEKALEDEIIIPLEDYSECYPNYNAVRSGEDMTLYNTVTPNGHIAAIFQMKIPQKTYQGPVIRADLLKSYGWEGDAAEITTLDDWAEVLEIFTANGMKTPWWGEGNFNLGFDEDILPAFDIYMKNSIGSDPFFFYQLDDVVKFGPAEDGFKDYLALYSDWYQKGYVSKDFINHQKDIDGDQPAEIQAGNVGIGVVPQASFDQINSDTDGELTAISIPLKTEGQIIKGSYMANLSRSYFNATALSISTTCPEDMIPVILKYFDYLYTDEGSTLANYGVEGVSWHAGENGEPVFEEFMTNSSEFSLIGMFSRYCCFHVVPFLYDYRREAGTLTEYAASLPDIWESHLADELEEYPSLSVPVDISNEYNSMYNEVVTCAKEYTLKVITGAEDLGSSWDNYIKTLNDLGLAEIIRIQQEAYDKFFETDVTVGMN